MTKCPLERQYGDIVCRDGLLWGLTYSECAPPDQRQCLGECEHPSHRKTEEKTKAGAVTMSLKEEKDVV